MLSLPLPIREDELMWDVFTMEERPVPESIFFLTMSDKFYHIGRFEFPRTRAWKTPEKVKWWRHSEVRVPRGSIHDFCRGLRIASRVARPVEGTYRSIWHTETADHGVRIFARTHREKSYVQIAEYRKLNHVHGQPWVKMPHNKLQVEMSSRLPLALTPRIERAERQKTSSQTNYPEPSKDYASE